MAITEEAAYARVICPTHGAQNISRRNFDAQIASNAAVWECPTCGRPAGFDHPYFAEHHGTPGTEREATS